jgi:acetyl esterase/lipase
MIQLSDSGQINIRIYTPTGGSASDGEDKPVVFVAHGGCEQYHILCMKLTRK